VSTAPSVPPARTAPRLASWFRLVGVAVLGALLAAGAFVGVQLNRSLPPPRLQVTTPRLAVPAVAAATLPWPREGQSALTVQGVTTAASPEVQHPVPVGSVAKVMTAYLVLRTHPLAPGAQGPVIRVSERQAADYRVRSSSAESLLPVSDGEALTERQALDALLVPSANNAADLLAEWTAGSLDAFIQRMNDTARQLRLTGTHYADASGYSSATTSTATDQVRLAVEALRDPTLATIVAQRQVDLPLKGASANYNTLLGSDGVFGVKTGSTRPAGGNVVFAARRQVGGRTLTIVGAVLGQRVGESSLAALGTALSAARLLLTSAEASLRPVRLLQGGTAVGSVIAPWAGSSPVVTQHGVDAVAAPGLAPEVTLQPAAGVPHLPGDAAGILDVRLGEQRSAVPLQLTAPLRGPALSWRLTRGF